MADSEKYRDLPLSAWVIIGMVSKYRAKNKEAGHGT
jgi:hypothetical protein